MDQLEPYYFDDKPEEIDGVMVPSITDDFVENYPTVVERFFTKYFYMKPEHPGEDYMVLFHSNRACLICLAPQHIALQKGVKSISFNVGNMDRSLNEVRGKSKRGGMILQENSALAIITCVDESTYKVPSCVQGKLIEVNKRVVTSPEILSIEGDGYVAIVLLKPENCENVKAALLSQDDYVSRKN